MRIFSVTIQFKDPAGLVYKIKIDHRNKGRNRRSTEADAIRQFKKIFPWAKEVKAVKE